MRERSTIKIINVNEAVYLFHHFREVKHVTLNPNGPGVMRVHMLPPKSFINKDVPCVIILNGQDILPINLSWAILLSAFIDEITPFHGDEILEAEWNKVISQTVNTLKRIYPKIEEKLLCEDLWRIFDTLEKISEGKEPSEEIGVISIGDYAKNMRAPHRIDLMISEMKKSGNWNCNQRCLHCYAADQNLAETMEISTEDWKKIINKCRKAGIPQLTFTGGEPTLRSDLVELIDYSKWFVARLNTNGVLLTKELCKQLYEASLDSVQVTLYSAEPQRHNLLVGAGNWEKTVDGIRNAIEAGLDISVNTPLCKENSEYNSLLKFIKKLGVKYASCSGLILSGNALKEESKITQLAPEDLYIILKDAYQFCADNQIQLSFTSPGWIEEPQLKEIGFTSIPTCGACLSNMAVAPNGTAIPCQSWLSERPLGNMLTDSWKSIWYSKRCREIRTTSAQMEQKCQLRTKN